MCTSFQSQTFPNTWIRLKTMTSSVCALQNNHTLERTYIIHCVSSMTQIESDRTKTRRRRVPNHQKYALCNHWKPAGIYVLLYSRTKSFTPINAFKLTKCGFEKIFSCLQSPAILIFPHSIFRISSSVLYTDRQKS